MDLERGISFSGRFLGEFWDALKVRKKVFMRKRSYKGRCEKRMLSKCEGVCKSYDAMQAGYSIYNQALSFFMNA